MTGMAGQPATSDEAAPGQGDQTLLKAVLGQADMIGGLLRVADGLAGADRAIDLAGLDTHVGLLCARALELRAEHRLEARCRLVLLVADLDRLSRRLRGAQQAAPA